MVEEAAMVVDVVVEIVVDMEEEAVVVDVEASRISSGRKTNLKERARMKSFTASRPSRPRNQSRRLRTWWSTTRTTQHWVVRLTCERK